MVVFCAVYEQQCRRSRFSVRCPKILCTRYLLYLLIKSTTRLTPQSFWGRGGWSIGNLFIFYLKYSKTLSNFLHFYAMKWTGFGCTRTSVQWIRGNGRMCIFLVHSIRFPLVTVNYADCVYHYLSNWLISLYRPWHSCVTVQWIFKTTCPESLTLSFSVTLFLCAK